MRELTFTGFLAKYVRSLSKQNTAGIYKLVSEAEAGNYRLIAPLTLYAAFSGKKMLFLRATENKRLFSDSVKLVRSFSNEELLHFMETQSEEMDEMFHKVWRTFQSERNRKKTDDDTKSMMRRRVMQLQEKSGISNYRIYTDLHLNPGNLNAWLKYGASDKVSLKVARKTLAYVRAVTEERL